MAALLLCSTLDAKYCKPVDLIMTRASGQEATFLNGTWSTEYPIENVNAASLQGSLQFTIMEAIDRKRGYNRCRRKNNVNFIHFYLVTMCQTDAALWWFNKEGRRAPYGPTSDGASKDSFSSGEFGYFLSFDQGSCHHENTFCHYLIGNNQRPRLGPYIGMQRVGTDPRNPTRQSYWYSLPGYCPLHKWKNKIKGCDNDTPSGRCPEGTIPDGDSCTWSYQMLRQVNLDHMVGITSILNNQTGKNFTNHWEFCKAGFVEFERNRSNHMVDGLPFWEKPLDFDANEERVAKMMEFYAQDERNIPIPSAKSLEASNPRCYQSRPGCIWGNRETCQRDQQMLCVHSGHSKITRTADKFPIHKLEKVPFPKPSPEPTPTPSPMEPPSPLEPPSPSPLISPKPMNVPSPTSGTSDELEPPGRTDDDDTSSAERIFCIPSLFLLALIYSIN